MFTILPLYLKKKSLKTIFKVLNEIKTIMLIYVVFESICEQVLSYILLTDGHQKTI